MFLLSLYHWAEISHPWHPPLPRGDFISKSNHFIYLGQREGSWQKLSCLVKHFLRYFGPGTETDSHTLTHMSITINPAQQSYQRLTIHLSLKEAELPENSYNLTAAVLYTDSCFFSSAWLCQQSYCHSAGVRRPSVRRPSVNSSFSETSAWIQTKFYGKLPIHHISRQLFCFFKIFNFQIFTIFVRFR